MTTTRPAPTRKLSVPKGREIRAASRAARRPAAPASETPAPSRIPVQPRSAPAPAVGKLGRLVELMRRPEGASLQLLCEETGWQPHSVRGALAGSLKRSRGYEISSERIDGKRVYRIAPLEPTEAPA